MKDQTVNKTQNSLSSRVTSLRQNFEEIPEEKLTPMIKDLSKNCETMFHWDIWSFQQWTKRT